jgi:hypothetical protein
MDFEPFGLNLESLHAQRTCVSVETTVITRLACLHTKLIAVTQDNCAVQSSIYPSGINTAAATRSLFHASRHSIYISHGTNFRL